MKFIYTALLLTAGLLSGISVARADLATFATVPVSGCPTCLAIDPTGLEAEAVGHQLFGGPNPWDVWANASERLTVANGLGVDFTLPGRTFDLKTLKLFGISAKYSTTMRLGLFKHEGANLLHTISPRNQRFSQLGRILFVTNIKGTVWFSKLVA